MALILDPYMVRAMERVTPDRLYDSLARLYPDLDWDDSEQKEISASWLPKWLAKARKRPGTALSTGRRNSMSGMVTCALLDALGAPSPKTARTRIDVAWALLDSPEGRNILGSLPELEAERQKRQGA